MTTAAALERASLFYRRPDLYDQLGAGDRVLARRCVELADKLAPHARTLLEFGTGTGRDLDELARRFTCVGVDIGPRMVAHTRNARPHLDVRLGDMRDFRLGTRVDVVACLGNTLAYLHDDGDIAAAFATFAAHTAPGGLLVVHTLTALVEAPPSASRVDAGALHAHVTVACTWDPARRLTTMERHWRHDDGTEDHDTIVRRVLDPDELAAHAQRAGLTPVAPGTEDGWFAAAPRPDGTRPPS